MNEPALFRLFLHLIGLFGLIGIGKYTNWQTALLLFLVLWANNAAQRDLTIREIWNRRKFP